MTRAWKYLAKPVWVTIRKTKFFGPALWECSADLCPALRQFSADFGPALRQFLCSSVDVRVDPPGYRSTGSTVPLSKCGRTPPATSVHAFSVELWTDSLARPDQVPLLSTPRRPIGLPSTPCRPLGLPSTPSGYTTQTTRAA